MNETKPTFARSMTAIGLLLLSTSLAAARETPSTPGALEARRHNGALVEMPLVRTEVRVEISAFVARATIEQTFRNTLDEPVEAVYTFPLPDGAAVDDFEIVVGDRVIRGEIRRREQARKIYREAKDAGYSAALLEQQRPNVFTQSVANLEPGGEVKVRLSTVETVPYEGGVYRWKFPLAVAQRYDRGPRPPMRTLVEPPPKFRSGREISIDVSLDAGVPVALLASPSHRILEERSGRSRVRVRLSEEDQIPNDDFVLEWNVAAAEPTFGLLAHRTAVDGFFTLLVQPKGEVAVDKAAPKEVVFVLDTSGSMRGVPIETSKRFIHEALGNLGPRDSFNLIRFAGGASTFSDRPLFNDRASVTSALEWVDQAQGGGGTEMLRGFRAAFELPPDPDRIRIVIFLTDGKIGYEDEVLEAIGEVVDEARIFTLGIGTSVNHYLLDRMAELGRGAYTFVHANEAAGAAVKRFRSWVTRPYLTDVEIDWGALPVVDVLPARLPDLYSGQTMNVVGRFIGAGAGEVVVRGRLGGRYWEQSVPVVLPERSEENASLASVWARRRIREQLLPSAQTVEATVRAEVTALALEYRLMSPFTSFVAVDESEAVNPGGDSATVGNTLDPSDRSVFENIFGAEGPPGLRGPSSPTVNRTAGVRSSRSESEESSEERLQGAGELHVIVYDDHGAVPGATVTIRHDRGFVKATTVITDREGIVRFPVLRPVRGYVVEVAFPGMGTRRKEAIVVSSGDTTYLTVRLAEEAIEYVRVKAQGEVVELEKTATSTRFSDEFIQDLPVPGRFYQNVLTLVPGVQDADGDGNPNVHGSRVRDYKAIVSGISNVDPLTGQQATEVNPNSIEELRVITAGAGVSFNRACGGFPEIMQKQESRVTAPPVSVDREGEPVLAALRVLADLAEDGILSPAEGIPAAAAVLAAQSPTGSISHEVSRHALATWALAEASRALPDDVWLRAGADRAMLFLADTLSVHDVDGLLSRALDESTKQWCLQLLDVIGGEADAGRTRLVDGLTGITVEDEQASARIDATLNRLVRALPLGNLERAGF